MKEEAVSAAEADRKFSSLMQGVRSGYSYLVTSHGKPVARIVPVDPAAPVSSGKELLLARLEQQKPVDIGPWTRDELYD